jgi:uroporphyrinogen decarboxylase
MTSKQRLLAALRSEAPDRLPATTHHLMPYFLQTYLGGVDNDAFFERFGLDPIRWVVPHRPDPSRGEYYDPAQGPIGFLESRRVATDSWRVRWEQLPHPEYRTVRYRFLTPKGGLSMVLQSNPHTSWVSEYLIKEKKDIELIAGYATTPKCDVQEVNREAREYGERGLLRGHICCFDVFGQPGCWQDACCLVGTEKLILAAHDDPAWVHELLGILQRRKLGFVRSLQGAHYDLLELGGGDGSTTVISPSLFREFVAPYDRELIRAAHEAGQRVSYHTCGGMMPILEEIAGMQPDAMETFTPPDMGGDVDLAQAKKRIGDKVCLIGGFDQFHFLLHCDPQITRREVRRCFRQAGEGGGYILSPSDHFLTPIPGCCRPTLRRRLPACTDGKASRDALQMASFGYILEARDTIPAVTSTSTRKSIPKPKLLCPPASMSERRASTR